MVELWLMVQPWDAAIMATPLDGYDILDAQRLQRESTLTTPMGHLSPTRVLMPTSLNICITLHWLGFRLELEGAYQPCGTGIPRWLVPLGPRASRFSRALCYGQRSGNGIAVGVENGDNECLKKLIAILRPDDLNGQHIVCC